MTNLILASIAVVSLVFNFLMVWYARTSLRKLSTVYTASEEVSEIFSMIDTYGEHLQSVYEMPTFYGDTTLQGLLDHTKQMVEYLKKYENIYSFTQPDLEEQLRAASIELGHYDQEEEQKKRKSNKYFTQVHEDAILEYISCNNSSRRNVLYRDIIQPVFTEMITKIVFTYKFTNLPKH